MSTWTVSPKRGDWLRRLRCRVIGHIWWPNPAGTQVVCHECWTVVDR